MTPSVILRPLRKADLAEIDRWRNDEEVTRHLARPEMTFAEIEAWFAALQRTPDQAYAIVVDGEFAGYAVLEQVDDHNRKCEAGIIIGERRRRGQGIGREVARRLATIAFTRLGMHRILAVASARNPASIACFRAAGFQEEGRLREANLRDGEYVDLVLLSLLEQEWAGY